MTTAVLVGALRHLHASWRGQLGVLAVGTLLLGMTFATGDLGADLLLRTLVGSIELVLLVAASVRAARRCDEVLGVDVLVEELHAIVLLLPRLLVAVGAAGLPVVALASITALVAGPLPLAALLLVPLAFAALVLCSPVIVLAIVGVVCGERRWLPQGALAALRSQPTVVVGGTIVGGVLVALAALPLVLSGFVVTALAGGFGTLGSGLTTAAIVPFAGCWAIALWEQAQVPIELAQVPFDEAEQAGAPAPPVNPVHAATWVDGPSWDVAIEPGAVWGTWIQLEQAASLALRVTWSGAATPVLALGTESGTWSDPGPLPGNGHALPVALPAGNTYIQVASHGAAAQAVSLTLLLPSAAAA